MSSLSCVLTVVTQTIFLIGIKESAISTGKRRHCFLCEAGSRSVLYWRLLGPLCCVVTLRTEAKNQLEHISVFLRILPVWNRMDGQGTPEEPSKGGFSPLIGFDAVSTAAQEARHAAKDMTVGISWGRCRFARIFSRVVSFLLTGVRTIRIDVAAPVSLAMSQLLMVRVGCWVNSGAIAVEHHVMLG